MEHAPPKEYRFSTILTPALFLEFQLAGKSRTLRFLISNLLILFLLSGLTCYAFLTENYRIYSPLVFYFCILELIFFLLHFYQKKYGNKHLRKLASEKRLSHRILFREDGFHAHNNVTGAATDLAYSDIRSIIQSKKLLVLMLSKGQACCLERWTIMGGSEAQFLTFLLARCPNLRKKKVVTPKPGMILYGIRLFLLLVCLVIALVHNPYNRIRIPPSDALNHGKSYQEIAAQLENLGITGATDELLEILQTSAAENEALYGYETNRTLDLLCWLGAGKYDYETLEWTPAQTGVYWFDYEVFFVDTMYTDFLRGISALSPKELNFTDIQEDLTRVNYEATGGIQAVTFSWQGKTYHLEGRFTGDWLDPAVGDDLNRIIRSAGDKSLYFAFDGGQGCLVFYGDAQWASAFEDVTGIRLYERMEDSFNPYGWY